MHIPKLDYGGGMLSRNKPALFAAAEYFKVEGVRSALSPQNNMAM